MSNMLDYIAWRGDITFEENGFNEIDGLILSQIAYIPFDGIIPGDFSGKITLYEAARQYFATFEGNDESKLTLQMSKINEILKAAMESERFKNIVALDYVSKYEIENSLQFAATTWGVKRGEYIIAFRGTDDTIAGWEEDFELCFKCPVGAQVESQKYLAAATAALKGHFDIVGHSKGGNLAMFCSINLSSRIKQRINGIYSYDGPGFLLEVVESDGYKKIAPKIHSYIPQGSIVGMIMYSEEDYCIVHSTNHGILQHIAASWELVGKHFMPGEKLSGSSRIFGRACKKWISEIDSEARENFVTLLFQMLKAGKADTIGELGANIIKAANGVLKSYIGLDKTTRKMLRNTTAQFIKLNMQSITEDISENIINKPDDDIISKPDGDNDCVE